MRTVELPYEPRSAFLPYHNRKARFSVLVCHRRSGKTVSVVNDLLIGALECPHPRPQLAYIAPDYQQAKRIAWEYTKYYSQPVIEQAHESELRVTLKTGAKIFLLGAERADSLRGMYLDAAALDETAQIRPSAITQVIMPCLSDRQGWMTLMGTPKGKNHFYDYAQKAKHDPSWFYMMLKASESGILPQEELDRQRSMMDDSDYQQEYECSFEAALKGAIYGVDMEAAEVEGRIGDFPVDPDFPVDVVCDLGYTDDTVLVFFQLLRDHVRIVKVYVNNETNWDTYLDEMESINTRQVYLPHDARAKNLQTGRSIVEQTARRGFKPRVVPDHKLRDGIAATRKLLPFVRWNRPECNSAVEAMKSYRRKWDDKLSCYLDRPVHDWSSHIADAVRYLGVVFTLLPKPQSRIIVPVHYARPMNYQYSLEDLFNDARTNPGLLREQ